MTTYTVSLSPVLNEAQYFDESGAPLNGGMIYQFLAGSGSIYTNTYTDISGTTENPNPIVLDSSGRAPTSIWLANNTFYGLWLTDQNGNVLQQYDNVSGVPILSSSQANNINIWNSIADLPSYVSATQFLCPGNHVENFHVGNRVRATTTSGYVFGTVTAVSFTNPNTHVTLQMDAGTLNSSLSAVEWSALIQDGRTVDAGAVSYSTGVTYSGTNTVGAQINAAQTAITNVTNRVNSLSQVWPAGGSGSNTPYYINPNPAIPNYTIGQIFTVYFSNSSSDQPTMNVNGMGALPIYMYDYTGSVTAAVIVGNTISNIAYYGGYFIYLDQLPAAPVTGGSPHGQDVFTSNGTFYVPAGVYSISVMAVGGGGSGGNGNVAGERDTPYYSYGGQGGYGGVACKVIAVNPGDAYAVSIGAGGLPPNYLADGANGNPGASTTFGPSLCIGTGGGGGFGAPIADITGKLWDGKMGINGYDSVGNYSLYNTGLTVSGTTKGVGGVGGFGNRMPNAGAGSPGACVVTW